MATLGALPVQANGFILARGAIVVRNGSVKRPSKRLDSGSPGKRRLKRSER